MEVRVATKTESRERITVTLVTGERRTNYAATYIENEDVWRLHSPDGAFMADFTVYGGIVTVLGYSDSNYPPDALKDLVSDEILNGLG